jgi:hypothetical protein
LSDQRTSRDSSGTAVVEQPLVEPVGLGPIVTVALVANVRAIADASASRTVSTFRISCSASDSRLVGWAEP